MNAVPPSWIVNRSAGSVGGCIPTSLASRQVWYGQAHRLAVTCRHELASSGEDGFRGRHWVAVGDGGSLLEVAGSVKQGIQTEEPALCQLVNALRRTLQAGLAI
jgi:hypothetical protein